MRYCCLLGSYTLTKFGSFLNGLYDREARSHNLNVCIEYGEAYRGERSLGSLVDELCNLFKSMPGNFASPHFFV